MTFHTSNKLKILISIFFIGFISLFSVNELFTTLVKDLDKQTTVYETKIKIGEFLAEDIQNIKALFFELALTTSSKRSRQLVIDKIDQIKKNIHNALDVLEHGGTLVRQINLNVAGKDAVITELFYDISKVESKISLEVIDIRPKLIELNKMINEVTQYLVDRKKFEKSDDLSKYKKISSELKRYYKTTPAFFNRMSENIKRLLYEGENELLKIKDQVHEKQEQYLKIKIIMMFVVISIITLVGIWLSRSINTENNKLLELNEELESKENFAKAILNGQENIVIVSDGKQMIEANDYIVDFFDEFNTIDDFKNNYTCICEKFEEKVPDDSYINKTQYDTLTWLEYILQNSQKHFKVIMNSGHSLHHFSIVANKKLLDKEGNYIIVVSLNDITNEVNSQIELENLNENLEHLIDLKTKELQELNNSLEQKIQLELQKNREKDKQMIQQSRFAALGEMIGNIAHQWRQPLSAISSTASSLEVQIDLGIATEDEIKKSYKNIRDYVEFLTHTIEAFRGFFKEDKELVAFDIKDVINNSLSIINATYKDNNIELTLEIPQKNLNTFGMPNELSQVFLNVLNNARDAIKEKNIEKRLVAIFSQEDAQNNIIYIQDNAGGIPEDIIDKIFDPYFTTKHQSQGTGIGLYMSKDIVEKNMKGSISVQNKIQTIHGNEYNGACFKIVLPKYS